MCVYSYHIIEQVESDVTVIKPFKNILRNRYVACLKRFVLYAGYKNNDLDLYNV